MCVFIFIIYIDVIIFYEYMYFKNCMFKVLFLVLWWDSNMNKLVFGYEKFVGGGMVREYGVYNFIGGFCFFF